MNERETNRLHQIRTLSQILRVSVKEARENWDASEADTRRNVIDPVIRALGWRSYCSSEWRNEYTINGGRVDYALLDQHQQPVVLIEAKGLLETCMSDHGQMVQEYREQLFDYVEGLRTGVAVLTNGLEWHLWDLSGRKRRGRPVIKDKTTVILTDLRYAKRDAEVLNQWMNKQNWYPNEIQPDLFHLPE